MKTASEQPDNKEFIRAYLRSSSFKMAALFTTLLGMCGILLGYYLYDFNEQNFIRETEAAIDMEITHILSEVEHKTEDEIILYIETKSQMRHPLYFLTDFTGVKLAGNIESTPANVRPIKEGLIGFGRTQDNERRNFAAKIHTFEGGMRLLIARDVHDILDSHARLRLFSALIMGFMLAVILVSFVISTFVVSRINIIARTAKDIMDTGDLSRRISIDTNWDDLSNLAQVLNELLEQIETLMAGIRDVSDNIAHDLRTPLTRLRNDLEQARQNKPKPSDIDTMIAEADHLLSTFNSLLRISNIEKGKRHSPFEKIEIHAILCDVVELYEPVAEDKDIQIASHITHAPPLLGDRDLLFQLFANLLDNAIKFSPEGSVIHVNYADKHFEITDQGTGIPNAEQARVFDRFYRMDKSRNTSGTGLGLSLVKAILDLHKAHITLGDNAPGLKVMIEFK